MRGGIMNEEVMQLKRKIWKIMRDLSGKSRENGRTFDEFYNRIWEVIGDEPNQLVIGANVKGDEE